MNIRQQMQLHLLPPFSSVSLNLNCIPASQCWPLLPTIDYLVYLYLKIAKLNYE